jgi:hypothetical protein
MKAEKELVELKSEYGIEQEVHKLSVWLEGDPKYVDAVLISLNQLIHASEVIRLKWK